MEDVTFSMIRKPTRRGARPKYPWQEWLGKQGDSISLRKGRDYQCQTHAFAIQVRQAAQRLRIIVSVFVADDVVTIENKGVA